MTASDPILFTFLNSSDIEPRVHLTPDPASNGHFDVLRGCVTPPGMAGVRIMGDHVDNRTPGLPSETAPLNLSDPRTGMPPAVLDATAITEMRTGAITAPGARHPARPGAGVRGHIGARATSYRNVRLLDRPLGFDEIRVHPRRPESREVFAERLERDLGKPVTVTADRKSCVEGAGLVVEASRPGRPEPLLRTERIAVTALTDIMDEVVVDDRGQCRSGTFGALRAHVESGRLSESAPHAELREIVAGDRPGRERDDGTVLFRHRGPSLSDIALGAAVLAKARERGLGQRLRFS